MSCEAWNVGLAALNLLGWILALYFGVVAHVLERRIIERRKRDLFRGLGN